MSTPRDFRSRRQVDGATTEEVASLSRGAPMCTEPSEEQRAPGGGDPMSGAGPVAIVTGAAGGDRRGVRAGLRCGGLPGGARRHRRARARSGSPTRSAPRGSTRSRSRSTWPSPAQVDALFAAVDRRVGPARRGALERRRRGLLPARADVARGDAAPARRQPARQHPRGARRDRASARGRAAARSC